MNKEKIGLVSLWVAIAGLIVSVIPGAVFMILINKEVMDDDASLLWLCVAVFFVSQVIALSAGIVGRHTPSGKAGLIISAISIAVAILVIVFITPVQRSTSQASL